MPNLYRIKEKLDNVFHIGLACFFGIVIASGIWCFVTGHSTKDRLPNFWAYPMLVVAVITALSRAVTLLLNKLVKPISRATFEEKLSILEECGIKLAEPFTVDYLLKSYSRADYEKAGFEKLLVGLGTTEEQEPYRNLCVNLWHFDTECIEDDGDYKKIAERMAEMTKGSLRFENVRDSVDIEKEKASLSFSFNGQDIKINCKVEDDWVDTAVFNQFVNLLKQADPSKVYIYYDLGGQDCIIGCVTKKELKRLNDYGIDFGLLSC